MADTKNFGLKGVGNDVQLGKAGSRFNLSGTAIQARNAADSAFVNFKVLTPVADEDAATKLYVDNVASGLDPKESCRCATTANVGTYASGGGAAGNGQLTSVPASIDGVTLAEGDRVLIKNQSTATQNGIYVVTATTTTLDRADDHNSNAEVSAGNFTFIEEGTVNADSGWVLQGPDPLTINSSNLNWVLFTTSSDIVAGDGIAKSGNTLNLDFTDGTFTNTVATVGADQIAFADASNSDAMQLRTWTNVLADLDIVTATADGMLVRTAADTYASRTITASAVAGDEGISIVNGDGVSGNPTIGIDIVGQTNLVTDDIDDNDELLMYHSVAGGTEGLGNYAVTAIKLKNYVQAGTSSSSITAGDTTVQVTDAGTGQVEFNIDGGSNDVLITAATSQFNNNVEITTGNTLTVADLTENDVLIAGASGLVEDSGGNLTFDGTTLGLTGSQTISADLTVGESVYVTEAAAAGADTAGDGQVWVRNDAPNTLMFTDDAGNDFTANNVLEIEYAFDSATAAADPGAGTFRLDNATIGSVTNIYIDDLDNTARDNSIILANLASGDLITIRSSSDPADYFIATVNAAPTDNTGYWTVPVTPVHTGTIFTNGDLTRMSVEWQSQGSTSNILVTDESADTTTFPVFVNSATGSQAPHTNSAFTFNSNTGQLGASSLLITEGADTVTIDHDDTNALITTNAGVIRQRTQSEGGLDVTTLGADIFGSTAYDGDPTAGGNQDVYLGLKNNSGVFVGGLGYIDKDTTLELANNVHGGRLQLYTEDGTGGGLAQVEIFPDSNGIRFQNHAMGRTLGMPDTGANGQVRIDIEAGGASNNDQLIRFVNDITSPTIRGTIGYTTSNDLEIGNDVADGNIILSTVGGNAIEIDNTTSAVNGLLIKPGATGTPVSISSATGTADTNVDIGFATAGTGVLSVTAGTGNYEDNVTADDDIPNKKYVDDQVAAAAPSGSYGSVTGTIDLTSATTQNIGAADGIPANATIMSVTLDITTASDAVTTVTIGDATNGAASYMAASENDPEVLGIYIADGRLANGGADRQAQAVVATAGTVGAATVIITFRVA